MKLAFAAVASAFIAVSLPYGSANAETSIPKKDSPIIGNDGKQLCVVKDVHVGLAGQIRAIIGSCGAGWHKRTEEVTFEPPSLIAISALEGKVLVNTNRERLLQLLVLIVRSEIIPYEEYIKR